MTADVSAGWRVDRPGWGRRLEAVSIARRGAAWPGRSADALGPVALRHPGWGHHLGGGAGESQNRSGPRNGSAGPAGSGQTDHAAGGMGEVGRSEKRGVRLEKRKEVMKKFFEEPQQQT